MVASFGGKVPRAEQALFVADSAVVLGDVTLEEGATVWYGAVLRGDEDALHIGRNTNVQDNAVIHCDKGYPVCLGENVTVGHSALVHGCTVGDDTLIGMHAVLLNGCTVGKRCLIGAGAVVPEGMTVPDDTVVVGVPARILKAIRPEQLAENRANAELYLRLGAEHAAEQAARQA